MPSWCGAQLKHRDNFTFYLYLTMKNKYYMLENYIGRTIVMGAVIIH
jgi:hypothetical protein